MREREAATHNKLRVKVHTDAAVLRTVTTLWWTAWTRRVGGCGAARGHGRRGTPWVSRANFVTEPERCCNARVMTHKSRGGVREIDYKCCASRSLTVAFDLTCDHGMARNYPSGGVASCSSSFREFRQRWRRRHRLLRLRLRLRRHQTRARRLRVSSWALLEQERGPITMASITGQLGSCQQQQRRGTYRRCKFTQGYFFALALELEHAGIVRSRRIL